MTIVYDLTGTGNVDGALAPMAFLLWLAALWAAAFRK